MPLVVHCRNGWDEIFDLIAEKLGSTSLQRVQRGETLSGVFHSWTGNWGAAKKALDLGFYISFSGIVTFKNASDIQEAAKKAPLDRIILETDSPFLTPGPLRTEKNEPRNVKIIAQLLASLRNQPFDEVAKITAQNVKRLFGI